MALKGLIVYFDGPDGVGKTTQLKMASESLRAAGHDVYETHVLGGSAIGDHLREAMMAQDARPPETDLHIALAAQYASLRDLEARRNNQQIVLVDRSPLSIIAYQVYADGLNADKGFASAEEILSQVKPDAILLFNASLESLLGRRQVRNDEHGVNYFETKPPEYHQETIKGYQEAAGRLGAVIIDAESPIDEVHSLVMSKIQSLLS